MKTKTITFDEINHLLATNDFRQLDDVLKRVKLVLEYQASTRLVAKTLDLSRGQLRRAVKSWVTKGETGRNGRPPLLNAESSKSLAEWVEKSADRCTPVKFKAFQAKVCDFSDIVFFCLIHTRHFAFFCSLFSIERPVIFIEMSLERILLCLSLHFPTII